MTGRLPINNILLMSTANSSQDYAVYRSEFTTTGFSQSSIVPFSLYPNPSIDKLNIELIENNEATYSIYDLQGKKLHSSKFLEYKASIDISILSPNVYFLIIEQGNKKSTTKFVKE